MTRTNMDVYDNPDPPKNKLDIKPSDMDQTWLVKDKGVSFSEVMRIQRQTPSATVFTYFTALEPRERHEMALHPDGRCTIGDRELTDAEMGYFMRLWGVAIARERGQ